MEQQPTGQQDQQTQSGLPQVKGPEMNDRDRINDMLATEKYLTTAYNVAVNEASSQQLYQTQMNFLTELHQCQRDLFTLMQQKGWYKTDPANPQFTAQAAQKFSNYRTQFPYS
ncbi:spore coat protein [Paludifilum halophilum]|uniref:Spore coat protein n=1 Tax=Paludifilum halophilum TaxID=1642702 RepID=A0A235B4M4_9BACL|nr:spore coat protein [Paludifilum halophilum]OYD07233.1 hypothetical protein CHM34_12685 [Paludifilum halophilum]